MAAANIPSDLLASVDLLKLIDLIQTVPTEKPKDKPSVTTKKASAVNKLTDDVKSTQLNDPDPQSFVKVKHKCNGSIIGCSHLKQMKIVLSKYLTSNGDKDVQISDNINAVQILNTFNHLLSKHHSDTHFKEIYKYLNIKCDISKCNIFRRHYGDRCRINNNQQSKPNLNNDDNDDDNNNNVIRSFINTIHCHFIHSYDIGYRKQFQQKLTVNDQLNQTNSDDTTDIKTSSIDQKADYIDIDINNKFNQFNSYDFSVPFYYWDDYKNKEIIDFTNKGFNINERYVQSKYISLKEEMINNDLVHIRNDQWQSEYDKSLHQIQTDHFKNLKAYRVTHSGYAPVHNTSYYGINEGEPISKKHLISIQIYCGFSNLCCVFSSTFRRKKKNTSTTSDDHKNDDNDNDNKSVALPIWIQQRPVFPGMESNKEWKDRHSHYYWLARYIIEGTNVFSPRSHEGNIKEFYHGINTQMIVDCIGLLNYTPLSASRYFEVAQKFSKPNGIILKFECIWEVRYFDCQPLSIFPYEGECLFIHSPKQFIFTDLTNTIISVAYDKYIKSFTIIERLTTAQNLTYMFGDDKPIPKYLQLMIRKLIKHQMKQTIYKNKEMQQTFKQICLKKDYVRFHWKSLLKYSVLTDKNLLFIVDYKMVDLDQICKLYSNLQIISMQQLNTISSSCIDYVIKYISNHKNTKLKYISIEVEKQIKGIQYYTFGFKQECNWWIIDIDFLLRVSKMINELIKDLGNDFMKILEEAIKNKLLVTFFRMKIPNLDKYITYLPQIKLVVSVTPDLIQFLETKICRGVFFINISGIKDNEFGTAIKCIVDCYRFKGCMND